MNDRDTERAEWVQNEEDLYVWWQMTKQSLEQFVRTHRGEIDSIIRRHIAW